MGMNYKSAEECAYAVFMDRPSSIGAAYKMETKECWAHEDIGIPLGKVTNANFQSCQFDGKFISLRVISNLVVEQRFICD